MSVVLAIETATEAGSVAVGWAGAVVAEVLVGTRRHAAELLPATLEALRLAKAEPSDVTRVVVADGPGSFTGLRIGFATAKALRRATAGATLHTAPSLRAAAFGVRHLAPGPIAALYRALRGDVFAAVYQFEEAAVRTHFGPTCMPLEDVVGRCPTTPGVAVGDGALDHAELTRLWTGRAPLGPPEVVPRAGALLELLALAGGTQPIPDPDTFEPAYGRPAEAQARWEREHGRPLPDSGVRPR